ncbi:metallophosphoesterase family protein [Devosia sp. Root635]|uniref:metallophosphoesterase family protein n=1 Tax=Devosia sp. Root635 TaxID=1736575 RepID=UPI0006F3B695|nr:metallophosphoesterase family protein [Devosia sp. Root635]KRA45707.1 hypothetical protein ASD80_05115 [Devosia sp. Root635]
MLFNPFRRPAPRSARSHLSAADWPEVVYAIGDVHGCLDELRNLERNIATDAAGIAGEKWIVMLGDYVDRGNHSAGVLDRLTTTPPTGFRRICLAGNHETMMLRFLETPAPNDDWLKFGGLETLSSYGISMSAVTRAGRKELKAIVDSHIPQEHVAFLQDLPLTLSLPGVVFVHAGLRPGIDSVERQSEDDLLWIRDEFFNAPPVQDRMVVHGHTPAAEAVCLPGRICVDTGAFATGRLTAARLRPQEPVLLLTN